MPISERRSHLPGRLRPLDRKFSLPTRSDLLRRVDWATRTKPNLNSLLEVEKYHLVLLDYIDANIGDANGDSAALPNFLNRFDPNSENYDPRIAEIARRLDHHFAIVDYYFSTLPKPKK